MDKILIYDDEELFTNILRKGLAKLQIVSDTSEIKALDEQTFKDIMDTLNERRLSFRENGEWRDSRTPLDEASIFIVDYDLVKSTAGEFLTGETVAYLTRCFSSCGLIVGVNQFGDNTFDLTLKGHPESFADLNIGSSQLSNPNLWGGHKKRILAMALASSLQLSARLREEDHGCNGKFG